MTRPWWRRRTSWAAAAAMVVAAVVVLALLLRPGSTPAPGGGPGVAHRTPGTTASASPSASAPPSATATPTAPPRTAPPTSAPPRTAAPVPAGFRSPATWPFASTSIWNTPIGSGAVYVPAAIAPATQRTVVTDQDIIVMQPTAPVTPIQFNGAGWSGGSRCSGGATMASAPIPSSLVVPSSKGNNSFAILMADGRTVLQGQPLARCAAGGPATTGSLAPAANLYTDGTRGAHGGSGLSSLGGTIRLGELVPGAPPIRHALKVNLDGAMDYWPIGFRWPAVKEDGYGPQRYGGKVPALQMGALLALPASLNLASLNLQTGPGRMIAWTLQNYGAYCVDDAARPVFSIATETGPAGAVVDQFQAGWGYSFVTGAGDTAWARDIATIFAHLDVVANNSPAAVGGGGVRRQPLAPPFFTAAVASAQLAAGAPRAVLIDELWQGTAAAPLAPLPGAWDPLATALLGRTEILMGVGRDPPPRFVLV